MKQLLQSGLTVLGLWASMSATATALPGQTIDEAEAWLQSHPTLQARPPERLSLRRSDTPARRYTFHGSIYGPAGGSGESMLLRQNNLVQPIMVRSEKFTLVDLISGVSIPRLEEALRTLYGAEVYADYRRAQIVMVYSPSRAEDRGTARAARSQLLEGDLFAYLIEVIPDPDGTVYTGAVTVMLREDVAALRTGLRDREIERREREGSPSNRPVTERLLGT